MKLPKIKMRSVTNLAKTVMTFASDYAPEILLISGTVGLVGAVVETTVHATPKAVEAIDEAKEEKGEELTKTEVVKETWIYYIPTILMVGGSVTAIVASYLITKKRHKALVAACALATETATQYKDELTKAVGKDKADEISKQINSENMKRTWNDNNFAIETSGRGGTTLCFDPMIGKYFMGDPTIIMKVSNEINHEILTDLAGAVDMNEFYGKLGLWEPEIGHLFGWTLDQRLDITFDGDLAPDGVTPCLVLNYEVADISTY